MTFYFFLSKVCFYFQFSLYDWIHYDDFLGILFSNIDIEFSFTTIVISHKFLQLFLGWILVYFLFMCAWTPFQFYLLITWNSFKNSKTEFTVLSQKVNTMIKYFSCKQLNTSKSLEPTCGLWSTIKELSLSRINHEHSQV